MELGNGLGHLTYSTLVHPGDTWPEMRDSVATYLPVVKSNVSPDRPLGVSLRLSGASVSTLAGNPSERAAFADYLRARDLYVYTVNAFPYGPFKGREVMEQVYEPDWATQERTQYTMPVADVLVDLTDAIAAWHSSPRGSREWRTHFHVPVFLDEVGGFRTTRSGIEAALRMLASTPLSDHLEIETYTCDVLPTQFKTGDIIEYVSREIEWVWDQLVSAPAATASADR